MSADLTPSLVVGLRRGDAEAALLLDRLYRDRMFRFAWGYLGAVQDAEDAVQEIFSRVLEARTVPDDFRLWLYRVARNHCLNRLRSRGRRRDGARLPSTEPAGELTGPLSRLLRDERLADL